MDDHHGDGSGNRPLPEARALLRRLVAPHDRSERVRVSAAVDRRAAAPVTADRDVPGEDRAAMDGYAVVAADTEGASTHAPVTLDRRDRGDPGGAERAVPVDTGNALPAGADAVVRVERTEERGERLAVTAAVAPGEDVASTGEDVTAGDRLVEAGRRLCPSDLALLRSVGRRRVAVAERPRVSVVPTGDELVLADPSPGQTVETNGLLTARLVERWGGAVTRREIVPDERDALGDALERDADHDLVVTIGGSSIGARDLLGASVADRGEVVFHGVAIKPGHPLGVGVVEGTPVLVLPGYPVSCLVGAVQFLRPALAWLVGADPDPLSATVETLGETVDSDPARTQFVRVAREGGRVRPVRAAGASVLSSVAAGCGWLTVAAGTERLDQGASVRVERWER